MKMLKPKVIGEYAQGFNEVSSDLLSRLKQTRDDEGLIPNIKDELFKWSLECEFIWHVLSTKTWKFTHLHTSYKSTLFAILHYLSFNFSGEFEYIRPARKWRQYKCKMLGANKVY